MLPKLHKVKISKLRISSEDLWMEKWIEINGDTIGQSPAYDVYSGRFENLMDWCEFREIDWHYKLYRLMYVYECMVEFGQRFPIYIYIYRHEDK